MYFAQYLDHRVRQPSQENLPFVSHENIVFIAQVPTHFNEKKVIYHRVIALILVNIVPSWDIEGHELASIRRCPSEGQYSPISV